MILYYFPIAQNTGNKTVCDFFSEMYMLVYVCAHILLFFYLLVWYKSSKKKKKKKKKKKLKLLSF